MSKHKIKQQPTNQQVNIVLPSDMSAEQMKEIIADAIVLAEDKRQHKELEQREKSASRIQELIGYKDIVELQWSDLIELWKKLPLIQRVMRLFRGNRNQKVEHREQKRKKCLNKNAILFVPRLLQRAFKVVLKLFLSCFYPALSCVSIRLLAKEELEGDRMTFNLQKMLLSLLFGIIDLLLILAAIILFVFHPFKNIFGLENGPEIVTWIMYALCSTTTFVIATIFYIISREIESIHDRNQLNNISVYIISIISMILTAVALIVSNQQK